MSVCPWAPWVSTDDSEARRHSFAVLVCGVRNEDFAKALCHVARVKLHKVRWYLAGGEVSRAVRWECGIILQNAAWEREMLRRRASCLRWVDHDESSRAG